MNMNRWLIAAGVCLIASSLSAGTLVESERMLPAVQDVDVVVVGGSCGAVAAAEAAAVGGAKVFLATSYASLGEDVAGTLRVWADEEEVQSSELMQAMFGGAPASEGKVYSTPLKVKQALDRALLQAGVTFLTGSYATDVLTDDKGQVAGVVMANRSGRQTVRAKVVIDATDRAALARKAGAEITPFPAGEYTVSRVTVGDKAPDCGGRVVKHEGWNPSKDVFQLSGKTKITPALFECTFTVPFADGSVRSFAEAENAARDRTFTDLQLDAADRLFFIPPDHIRAVRRSEGAWTGAAALDLGSLQPAKTPYLYVLGPMADTTREAAAELVKPAAAIQVGARVGQQAAAEARRRGELNNVRLCGTADGTAADVREVQGMLTRPYAPLLESVACDARALPVLAETELIVAGGGTTGGPAAVAAVRHGIKTLVVEQLYEMGGVQTAGMICGYYYGNQRGFTKVIDAEVKATGRYRSQAKAEWYRAAVREGSGEVWFGSMAVGAVVEGKKLRGLVVVTPGGERGVVLAKAVIDATGNADVAAAVGEETEFYLPDELVGQGVGMAVIRLGAGGHNNDFSYVDDTDASDLSFFGLRTRQMTEAGWDVSQLVNSRERRRLVGVYQMTALDFLTARTFPDTIIQHRSRFDLHGWASGDFFWTKNIRTTNHVTLEANAPYRAILPKKLDGLLVVGIGMSADRDAMSILRMQADLQNQGYAAAYAVCLALREGRELRDVPVKTLQRHLVEQGIVPENVLTDTDSYPIHDSVLELASHNVMFGYGGLPFLFADPQRAKPYLLAKYKELSTHSSGRDPEVSLVYAHILAVLGDPAGEDELIGWVQANNWDAKWKEGLDAGGSRMGAYLLALGRAKSKKAVPVIAEKIRELVRADKAPSAAPCRIVALVSQMLGEPALAEPLATLLDAPDVAGHAIRFGPEIPPVPGYDSRSSYSQKEKGDVTREINLAAALHRLGDKDGKGEAILKAYADDPRGFCANYARRVLAERGR
ncbi:MAG: FAD-dependent oxidoreductase [Planctomycetaceae bacterium]|nr:FAD-dependent oxidoreductase [Planctomycetaceae bacterium]